MRLISAMLIFLGYNALCCEGRPIDHLISMLDDEDFNIREEVTEELSKKPAPIASILLNMASIEESQEVAIRLTKAAKVIFLSTTMRMDETWLEMHGDKGLMLGTVSEGHFLTANRRGKGLHASNNDWSKPSRYVRIVEWASDDTKLKRRDIIIEVDGQELSMGECIEAIPGRLYSLKIRRPRNDSSSIHLVEGLYPEDYDELDINVLIGWKEYLSETEERIVSEYEEIAWEKYCISLIKQRLLEEQNEP